MGLSNKFDDLKVEQEDGTFIILETFENGMVLATEEVVEKRIDKSDEQVKKWADWIKMWKEEGRI